jgi:hypothetical protein
MVTLIERHLHGFFSSRSLPRLATTGRGNFVSDRDGLIYIKGTIGASFGSMAHDMFFKTASVTWLADLIGAALFVIFA